MENVSILNTTIGGGGSMSRTDDLILKALEQIRSALDNLDDPEFPYLTKDIDETIKMLELELQE